MSKKYFGNSVLIAAFIFGLWAGMEILQTYGEAIGPLFPAYIIGWILVVFSARFAIEWVINKLWRQKA